MTLYLQGIDGIYQKIGEHLGYSQWHTVTQNQINAFADATGDHQWIHVDVEKAKLGPFGHTIAHGYLTLSLIPMLIPEVVEVVGVSMGLNYGANKVRFPSPLPAGSKIRLGATISSVSKIEGGAQMTLDVTVETEGTTKPCLFAQVLFNYYT